MNREEAKELLIHILMTYEPKDQYGDYDDPEPYEQALTMAIEALQAEGGDAEMNEVKPQYMQSSPSNGADLISRADAVKTVIRKCSPICDWQVGTQKYPDCVVAEINALPSAEAETVDCTEFIRWLTETVMDDGMWELNAVAYGEVIARKLTKLGVLEVKDDVYVYEPSAEPKTDEENELKFYYVESIDDYWVGRRLDNFYYANWHKGLGFVWSHSRYLPWGEHIVDENTLWKEHTYPSEPIEIPFTEWVVGFVKKYFTEPKTGEWIPCSERLPEESGTYLTTTAKGSVCTDHFYANSNDVCGRHWSYHRRREPIAWMPLPKPYREDGDA